MPEAVATFRAQLIGPLLTRVFTSHGDLACEIRTLARQFHLPPGASVTRRYSETTIERWYYRFKKYGLRGVTPKRRSDIGSITVVQRFGSDLALNVLCLHGVYDRAGHFTAIAAPSIEQMESLCRASAPAGAPRHRARRA